MNLLSLTPGIFLKSIPGGVLIKEHETTIMFSGCNAFTTINLKELLSVQLSCLKYHDSYWDGLSRWKNNSSNSSRFNRLNFKDGNTVEALSYSRKGSY